MKYRDEKFYWTYQRSVSWPDDYIGPDSMTRWILEKSDDFTDVGLLKISESVRAYTYLILISQASARSGIVGSTVSTLTVQSAFLNNFENVANRRVDIREDIKHYQDTLSYASSKVDYSVGQNIYMLPSDMDLKVKTGTDKIKTGNDKILVSNEKFSLGKNVEVKETPKISHQPTITQAQKPNITDVLTQSQKPTHTYELAKKPTYEDEKIALILFLTGGFTLWFMF